MGEFVKSFELYTSAVVSHMLTLLAGCAATVLLDQARRLFKRRGWVKDDWPDLWWLYIMLAFLFFASFQAWEEQSLSRAGRERDLHQEELKVRSEQTKYLLQEAKAETCGAEKGAVQKLFDGLSKQLFDFQGPLNTCVVALARNNKPEPLTITSVVILLDVKGMIGSGILSAIVARTNKDISPFNLEIECDADFELVGLSSPDSSSHMMVADPTVSVVTKKKVLLGRQFITWDSNLPLVLVIASSKSSIPRSCNVSKR